jgi:DNA-binding MarR family transcriptional regulator
MTDRAEEKAGSAPEAGTGEQQRDQSGGATSGRLDLSAFLPYRLNQAAERVSQRFAKLYRAEAGLTRPEWRVLATLGQFGTMTATEIGRHSAMHKTKVSRAVYSLESRHWLSRTPSSADRRVEMLALSPKGRQNYNDLVAIARDFEAALIATLGEEAAARLKDGLTAIEERLEPGR